MKHPGRMPYVRNLAATAVFLVIGLPSPAQELDTDGDGLSDVDELRYGTSVTVRDTDGDGLLDGWEVHGYRVGDLEEPLPAYGADPLHRDVFVEIDWMVGPGGISQTNALIAYQAAVDVLRVFRRSGSDLRIHFDLGPRIEALIPPQAIEPDADFSAFAAVPDEQKILPYQPKFPTRPSSNSRTSRLTLYDVYDGGYYFRPSRRNLFYYVVIAEAADTASDAAAAGDPSDDYPRVDSFSDDMARRDGLVDVGVHVAVIFRKPVPELSPELLRYHYSVSLLHELGHAFGLGHGGSRSAYVWDNTNYKPNYPSIMNYRYQFCGVDRSGDLPVMDFSHGLLDLPLSERGLVEPVGMGSLPNDHLLGCANLTHLELSQYPTNIDWNRDGRLNVGTVVEDINQNGHLDEELLRDHDDWGKLERDGFNGIGTRAYRGVGLRRHPSVGVRQVLGDFDGDGLTDVFLCFGGQASWALATGDGRLSTEPRNHASGNLASWRLGPASTFLAIHIPGEKGASIFAHRQREVALMDLTSSGPRLRWYEDAEIAGGPAEPAAAWRILPGDQFLPVSGTIGSRPSLVVTDGYDLGVLEPDPEDGSRLRTVWVGGRPFLDATEGRFVTFRRQACVPDPDAICLALAGSALVEVRRSGEGFAVRRLDRDGVIPPLPGTIAADEEGSDGWAPDAGEGQVPVDLDGDGSMDLLLTSGRRLGVVRWQSGLPWLLESVSSTLDGVWHLTPADRYYVGQFIPGGGQEVLVSNGASWATLGWDSAASSLRVLAVNVGAIPGEPARPIRPNELLLVGKFLPGESDAVVAHDGSALTVLRFEGDGFHVAARLDEAIGEWVFDAEDRIFPAQLDADPELEILVRRGLLFGAIDLTPEPRCTFVTSVDEETLAFESSRRFLRGDANRDASVDISDVVTVLGSLFLGFSPPACDDAADANDDGVIDITDAVFVLGFLFSRGVAPPSPGPYVPGVDPTSDALECAR